MRTIKNILFSLTILSIVLSSCSMSEIGTSDLQVEPSTESVWVRVQMDWSHLSQAPRYSTVAFFPEDGSEPTYVIMDAIRDSVRLRAGRYSAIAFNRTLNGHENIQFENIDDYDNFYARTTLLENVSSYYNAENELSANQPSSLYIDRRDIVDISQAMVNNDIRPMLQFKPTRRDRQVTLEVEVEGIDRLSSDGNIASISGMPCGMYMSDGNMVKETPVKYYSNMESGMKVDNGSTKGTMTFKYNSFGTTESTQMVVTLYLRNNQGENIAPIQATLSNVISRSSSTTWKVSIDLTK